MPRLPVAGVAEAGGEGRKGAAAAEEGALSWIGTRVPFPWPAKASKLNRSSGFWFAGENPLTLLFPRVEELAEDLTAQGYPATAEDFYAAERSGKHKLDEWLWPKIRSGELPRMVDYVYWAEYLRALMERLHAPEVERERVTHRLVERFKDIHFWSSSPKPRLTSRCSKLGTTISGSSLTRLAQWRSNSGAST